MAKSGKTIGIIGLGVMGLSLARNMQAKGFSIIGYDSDPGKLQEAIQYGLSTKDTLDSLIAVLDSPRRILIMVPAGNSVDAVLRELSPLLQTGDSVVDGGNSFFKDTTRREHELTAQGIHFLGLGVSGGQRGALEGPGMMAGGNPEAWTLWQDTLEAIAARYKGEPCVAYMGPGGAGHYVKMVHNGIEYAMMQNLAEAYAILKTCGRYDNKALAGIFQEWDQGNLGGYLTKISASIIGKQDSSGRSWLDDIKDAASHKGTGSWTVQSSLELGVPVPAIDAAVRQRQISAFPEIRGQIERPFKPDFSKPEFNLEDKGYNLGLAIHTAQLLVYIQGFHLLRQASEEYGFGYRLADIARIWRKGCIISSKIVDFLAISELDTVAHPFLLPEIAEAIRTPINKLKAVLSLPGVYGLALPCLAANYYYCLSFHNSEMETNLIQAQRDYFGGHGLELKSGEKTSLDWEGTTN